MLRYHGTWFVADLTELRSVEYQSSLQSYCEYGQSTDTYIEIVLWGNTSEDRDNVGVILVLRKTKQSLFGHRMLFTEASSVVRYRHFRTG